MVQIVVPGQRAWISCESCSSERARRQLIVHHLPGRAVVAAYAAWVTLPTDYRFWSRVVPDEDGCWLWTGTCRANGYGSFSVRREGDRWGKTTAHRWAYIDQVGPVPDGHEVDHLCRRRDCVRPDHLEAVPLQENRRRRDVHYAPEVDRTPRPLPDYSAPPPKPPKRNPHLCKNGHDRREVGTVKNGKRRTCKACRDERTRRKRKGGQHGTETHCPAGHPYEDGNIYWHTRPDGSRHRECRACSLERQRKARERRRAEHPIVLDCEACGFRAKSAAGLGSHRSRKHG